MLIAGPAGQRENWGGGGYFAICNFVFLNIRVGVIAFVTRPLKTHVPEDFFYEYFVSK